MPPAIAAFVMSWFSILPTHNASPLVLARIVTGVGASGKLSIGNVTDGLTQFLVAVGQFFYVVE